MLRAARGTRGRDHARFSGGERGEQSCNRLRNCVGRIVSADAQNSRRETRDGRDLSLASERRKRSVAARHRARLLSCRDLLYCFAVWGCANARARVCDSRRPRDRTRNPNCLVVNFQDYSGDVIVWRVSALGKFHRTLKKIVEGFLRRFVSTLMPNLSKPLPTEIVVVTIANFMQAIGGKQDGVTGRKCRGMLFVGSVWEKPGRQSTLAQHEATGFRSERRIRQPGI